MLDTAEQQALNGISKQLTRDDPELARLLSPALQQAPARREREGPREGLPWSSWVLIYLVVLPPHVFALFILEPVAAGALVVLPAVLGLLAQGRRVYRKWHRSSC